MATELSSYELDWLMDQASKIATAVRIIRRERAGKSPKQSTIKDRIAESHKLTYEMWIRLRSTQFNLEHVQK